MNEMNNRQTQRPVGNRIPTFQLLKLQSNCVIGCLMIFIVMSYLLHSLRNPVNVLTILHNQII